MFRRIGLPFVVLASARPERLACRTDDWGSYYSCDPEVCAGVIADGQAAIEDFLRGRNQRRAVRA
jgi:hypothetical protein